METKQTWQLTALFKLVYWSKHWPFGTPWSFKTMGTMSPIMSQEKNTIY